MTSKFPLKSHFDRDSLMRIGGAHSHSGEQFQAGGNADPFGYREESGVEGNKLAQFPFLALLPHCSVTSELMNMQESIEQHLEEIIELRNSREVSAPKRSAEELMLNQVLQWLEVVFEPNNEEKG